MNRPAAPGSPSRPGVIRSILSTLVLLAVVAGAPIAMRMLGGDPLQLNLGSTVRQLSSHQLNNSGLVVHCFLQAALILAWVAWIWLMICVAVEVRARVTGRSSVRLPASRSIQPTVALLVGAMLALSSLGRIAAAPKPENSPTILMAGIAGHQGRSDRPVQSSTKPLRVIEDWSPDHHPLHTGLTASEAESQGMNPHSEADISPPLATTASIQPPTSRPTHPEHLVAARETLWSIARDRLGAPMRWRDIADLNYGVVQPDGLYLTSEHWIRPGWKLALPREGGHRSERTTLNQPHSSTMHKPDDSGAPLTPGSVPSMPIGGSVLSAGVVNLLDRMRRVQQRYRNSGGYIRLPDSAHRPFEQRLRIGQGHEMMRAADLVLRAIAHVSHEMERCSPVVIGVKVQPESIALIVDRVDEDLKLPSYFAVSSDQRSVSLARSNLGLLEKDQRIRAVKSPAPLLVSAGQGLEGLVMVNLEALGILFVEGDPKGCDRIVRAFALELATSSWKDHFDLYLIGFGTEFERFGRVTSVTELGPFLHRLQRRRLKHEVLLGESGFSSFAQARHQDSSGRWDPIVILCATTVEDQDVIELSELADPHLGVSLIARGSSDGEQHVLRLVGSEKTLSVELLSSILFTQQVSTEELSGVRSLLDAASDRTPALRSDEPYASISVPIPSSGSDTPSAFQAFAPYDSIESAVVDDEVEFEVEVSVLGPIEIRGAAREFTRAWAKELVVYLAMHPGGASSDAWATALWPDRLMAPSSLHSTASVARRSLGQDRRGLDHLPRSHGRLALANTVGTDWSRFVRQAESSNPRSWRAALEMVRGRPFEGLRSGDWPTLEGIGPAIEAAVVDLSCRLAESCLSSDDAQGATWAARKGLLVSPYDERLYRILMRAADVDGNPAGVESVMSELIKLVADDIEPFDSVHPSTMALYRSLSRRRNAILRPH